MQDFPRLFAKMTINRFFPEKQKKSENFNKVQVKTCNLGKNWLKYRQVGQACSNVNLLT